MNPAAEDILEKTRRAIDQINARRKEKVPGLCAQIKEVVVIASSSRGGSSIFSEILRHSPELLHFKGEINPFLTLAGLSYPRSGRAGDVLEEQDAGPHHAAKIARLEKEMTFDVGVSGPVDLNDAELYRRFVHDLHWRLCVQWPELDLSLDFISGQVSRTLGELCRQHGWQSGSFPNAPLFHAIFLRNLRTEHQAINPYYYDLPPDLIRQYCPDAIENYNTPSSCIIEEPPFVPIVPRRYISKEMANSLPLIFKTPSNVYRLPFLKKLFPNARFRILHLVRNPADSINGLVDGWLYHGFFSHHLPQALNISGYSDRYPAWGQSWWKYDLPPGWRQWTDRPLEHVCGFQWQSAHREILDYIDHSQTDFLRIKFEDVIGAAAKSRQVFTQIAHWLGIDGTEMIHAAVAEDLPPVMTTTTLPPRKRRWFKKAALIRPVLTDQRLNIQATAKQLGYRLDEEINS